ncbi:hypothetical protein BH10CYA1_BH10CYA1_04270 [soil metagenome]
MSKALRIIIIAVCCQIHCVCSAPSAVADTVNEASSYAHLYDLFDQCEAVGIDVSFERRKYPELKVTNSSAYPNVAAERLAKTLEQKINLVNTAVDDFKLAPDITITSVGGTFREKSSNYTLTVSRYGKAQVDCNLGFGFAMAFEKQVPSHDVTDLFNEVGRQPLESLRYHNMGCHEYGPYCSAFTRAYAKRKRVVTFSL